MSNKVFLTMAKAIDKNSPRNYANVIGIMNNAAYVTDGYFLLRWAPAHHIGPNRTLTPELADSAVAYPNVESALPREGTNEIPYPERIDSLTAVLKPSWQGMPVVLQVHAGQLVLTPYEEKTTYSGSIFNPRLLMQALKGIPKRTCTKIELSTCEEKLLLTFDTPEGEFQVLLVAIRQ